jgi:hypothetical protein
MAPSTITTATTTSSSSSSQRPLLLLQKEVFTIYLEPLLKIHADQQQQVTYEDLTSSWQAAVASLGKATIANVDAAGKNTVVSSKCICFIV